MRRQIVVAAVSALCVGEPGAALAGLSFKQTTREEDSRATTETRVYMEGGATRIEMLSSQDAQFFPPGSYMLVDAEGLVLVNPSEKTYSRFDPAGLQNAMQTAGGGDAAAGAGAFEISDVTVEKLIDEPGEDIQGYSTRHLRYRTAWTMQMTGAPMRTSYEAQEDTWVTDQIDVERPVEAPLMSSVGVGLPADAQALLDAEREKSTQGFPLRQVIVQNVKADAGLGGLGGRLAQRLMSRAGGSTTMVVEASEIEQVDVDPAMFEIPADYREVDLFNMGSERQLSRRDD